MHVLRVSLVPYDYPELCSIPCEPFAGVHGVVIYRCLLNANPIIMISVNKIRTINITQKINMKYFGDVIITEWSEVLRN